MSIDMSRVGTTRAARSTSALTGDAPCTTWVLLTFKIGGADTAGQLWVKELFAPRGMASPLHVHSREDEAFAILEGELSFSIR